MEEKYGFDALDDMGDGKTQGYITRKQGETIQKFHTRVTKCMLLYMRETGADFINVKMTSTFSKVNFKEIGE